MMPYGWEGNTNCRSCFDLAICLFIHHVWPCMIYPPTGSWPKERRWAPHLHALATFYPFTSDDHEWPAVKGDKSSHTCLTALCLWLPGWAGNTKVKPIWILLKQERVSGSGINWAICKSAPHSRQITLPAPHHSVFYRPDALPAAQPTTSKHWRHKTWQSSVNLKQHKLQWMACFGKISL